MAFVHDRLAGLLLSGCIFFCCGLAGCGIGKSGRLVIGSKSSPSSALLSEILVQHLSHRLNRHQITRRQSLGNSESTHDALMSGTVDIYPETVGSAMLNVLNLRKEETPEPYLGQIQERYASQLRCRFIGPVGFPEARTVAIRRELSEREGIRTLTQAAAYEPGWAIRAQPDFLQEKDGLSLLLRHYPLRLSQPVAVDGEGQTTEPGAAEMVAGRSSDWAPGDKAYVLLEDDEFALPPYDIGFVVKQDTLQSVPGLDKALAELSGRITLQQMRRMRQSVESDQSTAEVVVMQFLKEVGLRAN